MQIQSRYPSDIQEHTSLVLLMHREYLGIVKNYIVPPALSPGRNHVIIFSFWIFQAV